MLTNTRLINAIGSGERISLSKLAITHLERTARPIRVAVDISIWLFQVQAGRGGKNPELRTLFFRLLKLLALPVHPLFVYDGQHKPPFKRGKAVSARTYGNAPIIQRSKDLIERFRFPWHEAPGEAEAECARLQQAGIVDAVMSNDVDALMFGSTFTIMNYSKESGTSTTAATHVTCYSMGREGHISNVPLDRAGMILFAMLSGGDYLPSGVPKCGSKLAAQIAKAQFGDDLLKEIMSPLPNLDSRLTEWRDRLQYELEENESGWFTTKHKAVRIPETFPDRTILKYYAEPEVSSEDEIVALKRRLKRAWDREIDPLAIRTFAAEHFEWNYRSGARKLIKLLAEPLVSYRLRLQRPVLGLQHGTLAPDCDTPWLRKVYKSRANFGTDGMTELQMDMLPIDVVGLDLFAEEPNPPLPSQETLPSQNTAHSGDEEDDAEGAMDAAPPTPSKSRVTKRYDPLAVEKVWVFETIARIGVPEVVKQWDDEQAAKAKNAAPKKPTNRRTGPRKKGPIDSSMQRGSILKYGTLTKEKTGLSSSNKTQLSAAAKDRPSPFHGSSSHPEVIDLETDAVSPSMYSQRRASGDICGDFGGVDALIDSFSSLSTTSPAPRMKRHPMARPLPVPSRTSVSASGGTEMEEPSLVLDDPEALLPSDSPRTIRMSYSVAEHSHPAITARQAKEGLAVAPTPSKSSKRRSKKTGGPPISATAKSSEISELEKAVDSLSLSFEFDGHEHDSPAPLLRRPAMSTMEDRDLQPRRLNTRKAKIAHLIEKPTESGDRPASSSGSTMATPQLDESSHEITPQDECKRTSQTLRASRKASRVEPDQRQTSAHLENVTICNGFWSIETPTQCNTVPATESTGRSSSDDTTEQAHGEHGKKKRIPRVSILDMI